MVDHNSAFRNTKINNPKKNSDIKKIDLRKVLIGFMVFTIITLGFTGYKINEINTRAFQVYLGGENIGIVRSEAEASSVMEEIKKELSSTYRAECVLDKDLTFEATHAKDNELIAAVDLKSSIKSKTDFLVSGYSITIDGEEIGLVKTQKDAQFIIDSIKEPYSTSTDGEIKDIKILEDLQIVSKEIPLNTIADTEKLIEFIKVGTEEIKTHVVEAGESFWTISMIYDISVDELISANPDRDPKKLKPGDEVKLLVPTSKLTVATVEEVEYTEATDFETIVETSDTMYTNQKKVKVEGELGESHIVANLVKHNGIEVEKEILKEEVIKEPIAELVVKGTKEIPKTAATGVFMMPTRGRFTSGYGSRWGRLHKGMDIAASTGTPINAADGGTVTHSGWQGTYGYMIEIDHGNGMKTRYAHASKLIVSKGTKVYKGQHIANVGNTGRSTGPHLHLEVLVNGVNVNPSKYFK